MFTSVWQKLNFAYHTLNGYLVWLGITLAILSFIGIAGFIITTIFGKLESKISAKRYIFSNAFIYALKKPVIFLFAILVGAFFTTIFQNAFGNNKELISSWVLNIRNLSLVIAITWTMVRFINRSEYNLITFPSRRKPVNHTTVLAIGRLSKIVLFILATLLVLGALHIDITGILAFGGAGTLVASFAAKDMLANFFGGFMLFLDRQFSVGDLIRSPDKNIEGIVEHIGWRVTTIRTLQKLALYVPNAVFLTISIENESRAKNRSIRQIIGLRYCDITKVPTIMATVEAMIAAHPDIDHNQSAYIVMHKLGESSLDCLLSCFTKTTQLVTFLKVQQDILLKISDIVHQHEADMAFPTTTLDLPPAALLALTTAK